MIKGENLNIEIDIPGIEKDNIQSKITENSFSIRATDIETKYIGSFSVCCPIIPGKVL